MNTTFTVENLSIWIANLKELAKHDTENVLHWFAPTAGKNFSIVGGWSRMFLDQDFSDIFCCSKSHPEYAMCVKIVANDDKYYPDFDSLNMLTDKLGNVDDTCIPLEWGDDPEYAAEFFTHEWERIMESHKEEI